MWPGQAPLVSLLSLAGAPPPESPREQGRASAPRKTGACRAAKAFTSVTSRGTSFHKSCPGGKPGLLISVFFVRETNTWERPRKGRKDGACTDRSPLFSKLKARRVREGRW